MKSVKALSMMIVLAVIVGGLWPMAVPGSASADLSKVDPQVADQLATNGQADFFAILTVQADVSGAARLSAKVDKTAYVYNVLRETAAQTQAPLLDYLDKQGFTYHPYYIQNMIHVQAASSAVVEWFAARPDVARVSAPPDPQLEPVTRGGTQPEKTEAVEWNITRVGAPDVWAMGFHGEGMVVAGNDTGVSYTHPALVNQYRGNMGGGTYDHNYNWWDGDSGYDYPYDYDGHGTHTMGTMVGDDGGTNQVGMAPGAEWIACAGLGSSEPLECFEFFLTPWDLNHLNPDPTKAPDAINNSWYDPSGFDYRPIIQSLNAAGIAVIKSAGNTGPSCSTISNPGQVPEIIATAAFAQGDTIASFSSRGPSSQYGPTILKPEVAAPGVNVRSSVPGGGYDGTYSGTSMAAPHSTGLVALIWSAAPCIQGDVPLTKQIMMETAEAKIDAQCPPFIDHPNDVWGWGVLDAELAVQTAMGYCAGQGGLEGTVTSGGSPLADVDVLAQAAGGYSKTDVTDVTGFYAMEIFSDTYTVTATKYGYQTAVIPGVEVEADLTTTLDIDMPLLPEYTVSGYVRDAATLEPLEATIQFLDAPLPPVTSDPATGFYSIDVAEGTWQLEASAADHVAQTVAVAVTGNVSQDFDLMPLCDVFADDVEAGNLGWTAQSPWAITTGQSHSPTHSWTESPSGNYGNYADTSLTSPVWDLTGYTGVTLSFWHRYVTESSYDYCYVEWSDDGATWTQVASYDGSHATWESQEFALPGLDGQATAQIRFHFVSDVSQTYDGWYVDDIVLNAGGLGCVGAEAPVAEFSSNSPVILGEPMVFTNETTGTPPIEYFWDFGDDAGTSTETDPSYIYGTTGTFTVTLVATNTEGTDDVQHAVVVLVPPCEAVTGVDLTLVTTGTIYPGDPVTFSADVLPDGATTPYTYTVDGGPATSTSDDPFTFVVTASEPGTQTVEIAIWNCPGAAPATATIDVVVTEPFYFYLPIVLKAYGPES